MLAFTSHGTCVAVGLTFSTEYLMAKNRALAQKLRIHVISKNYSCIEMGYKVESCHLSESDHLVVKLVSAFTDAGGSQ